MFYSEVKERNLISGLNDCVESVRSLMTLAKKFDTYREQKKTTIDGLQKKIQRSIENSKKVQKTLDNLKEPTWDSFYTEQETTARLHNSKLTNMETLKIEFQKEKNKFKQDEWDWKRCLTQGTDAVADIRRQIERIQGCFDSDTIKQLLINLEAEVKALRKEVENYV